MHCQSRISLCSVRFRWFRNIKIFQSNRNQEFMVIQVDHGQCFSRRSKNPKSDELSHCSENTRLGYYNTVNVKWKSYLWDVLLSKWDFWNTIRIFKFIVVRIFRAVRSRWLNLLIDLSSIPSSGMCRGKKSTCKRDCVSSWTL